MAKSRTPKDFFVVVVVARFIALFWLELVAPPPMLAHYFAFLPTGASFGIRGWGTPVTVDRKPPVSNQ